MQPRPRTGGFKFRLEDKLWLSFPELTVEELFLPENKDGAESKRAKCEERSSVESVARGLHLQLLVRLDAKSWWRKVVRHSLYACLPALTEANGDLYRDA